MIDVRLRGKQVALILLKFGLAFPIALCLSGQAFAQYGGGTMGTGGGSSNSGVAIGAGAGAAAAVAAGVLYCRYHNPSVTGCVQNTDDGLRLMDEKNNKAYALMPGEIDLKAGDRVKVKGKRLKSGAGKQTFQAQKVIKELGACNGEPSAGAAHPAS